MATTVKGTAHCPECGAQQDVKHDGRKFFITCVECKTMTSYQSKIAKVRIERKMVPLDLEPEASEIIEAEKQPAKEKLPARPMRASSSFLDDFADLF